MFDQVAGHHVALRPTSTLEATGRTNFKRQTPRSVSQ
jgi:hypothetical protein